MYIALWYTEVCGGGSGALFATVYQVYGKDYECYGQNIMLSIVEVGGDQSGEYSG